MGVPGFRRVPGCSGVLVLLRILHAHLNSCNELKFLQCLKLSLMHFKKLQLKALLPVDASKF